MGLRTPLHTKIAGVTYGNRQDLIKSLRKNQKLRLVREKNNRYDKNAVAIYAGDKQLGYIKKELAANLAPLLDSGEKYTCKIFSIRGGGQYNYGVNIVLEKITDKSIIVDEYRRKKSEIVKKLAMKKQSKKLNRSEKAYFEAKELWLKGDFDKSLVKFKKGIVIGNKEDRYYHACYAVYFYEQAPIGSEHGTAEEYCQSVLYATKHILYGNFDQLILYILGDVYAKLGTIHYENESSIHPIFISFFKHISILIFTYLLKFHKKMIERIDKNEGVSVDFKLNGIEYLIIERDKRYLTAKQSCEINDLFYKHKLRENGYIHCLMNDILELPLQHFKEINASLENEADQLLFDLLIIGLYIIDAFLTNKNISKQNIDNVVNC